MQENRPLCTLLVQPQLEGDRGEEQKSQCICNLFQFSFHDHAPTPTPQLHCVITREIKVNNIGAIALVLILIKCKTFRSIFLFSYKLYIQDQV